MCRNKKLNFKKRLDFSKKIITKRGNQSVSKLVLQGKKMSFKIEIVISFLHERYFNLVFLCDRQRETKKSKLSLQIKRKWREADYIFEKLSIAKKYLVQKK